VSVCSQDDVKEEHLYLNVCGGFLELEISSSAYEYQKQYRLERFLVGIIGLALYCLICFWTISFRILLFCCEKAPNSSSSVAKYPQKTASA